MRQADKLKYLTIALYVIGIIYLAGVPVLMMGFEAPGWTWTPRQPEYEQMIMGVYATLGIFLIMAAKNPPEHASLIWFTVWSNIVHGGIMFVHAIIDETEQANLVGDVPALFIVAAILWYLMPGRGATSQ